MGQNNSKCNKILLYLVYHDETQFVDDAIKSIIANFSSATFDVLVIDTSKNNETSTKLSDSVAGRFTIIKLEDILVNVVSFIFENYLKSYEFIIRLDADDVLQKNAIKLLFDKLRSDTNLSVVYGNWTVIDQENRAIKEISAPPPEALQGFHGACSMFRCSDLMDFDLRRLRISAQDGFAVYIHLLMKNCKFSKIDTRIFYYRRHLTNMSRNSTKLMSARCQILKETFSDACLDRIILVDTEVTELGLGDQEYIKNQANIYTVRNGHLIAPDRSSEVIKTDTLEEFFLSVFKKKKEKIIVINRKKIGNFYLDGLIETFSYFSNLCNVFRLHYASTLERPVWCFQDAKLEPINDYSGNLHTHAVEYAYAKVGGLNIFDYSIDNMQSEFIMTDNFFTIAVTSAY